MEGNGYSYFVQWHLTEKCNLRCRHCYQQSPTGELSYQDICKAINELAVTMEYWRTHYELAMSTSIHFTGGEPLLRSDLFDLLLCARANGFTTSLLSNGTLINDDISRRLREAGVGDVQISLDGTQGIHDKIRGKGTFRRALAGIRSLVAERIETNINMTISNLNFAEIDPVIQLAGELGGSAVAFSRLVPCGRGKELNEYLLAPEQLAILAGKLKSSGDNHVALVSRDPLFNVTDITVSADIAKMNFPIGGCAAGVFGITITADGTIMPCRRMNLPVGNIKTDSFRTIWAESPVLISLRSRQYYHCNCRTCQYWAVCRGCRAIALASARDDGKEDYLGADPQCSFYKAIIKS